MAVFDSKYWNAEVFGKYLETIPRIKQNAFLKAGVLRSRPDLKTMLADQTGGNFISIPMTGLIGGDALNYDGTTDVTATGLETFLQSMIVVGRMKAWKEKDFTFDITGKNFMEEIGKQVSFYWDDVDQATVLSILKGIFGVSTNSFNTKHTLDITEAATASGQVVGATTLNNATQKAFGANKNLVTMAIMHSAVSTTLENLQILEYRKQSDAEGIQRAVALADWNGRAVMIDDDVPALSGYYAAESTDAGALKVVSSSASTGQILLSTVQAADFYPANVAANDYVVAGNKYTTYLLGQNAFDYCDCGAKVPNEVWRDPKTDGGEDWLITRQRKLFAPRGFSFVMPSSPVTSPENSVLETAARWDIVKDTNSSSRGYFPSEAIPFARIISRG